MEGLGGMIYGGIFLIVCLFFLFFAALQKNIQVKNKQTVPSAIFLCAGLLSVLYAYLSFIGILSDLGWLKEIVQYISAGVGIVLLSIGFTRFLTKKTIA